MGGEVSELRGLEHFRRRARCADSRREIAPPGNKIGLEATSLV